MNKIQKFIGKVFLGLKEDELKILTEAAIDNDEELYRKYGANNVKGLNPISRDRQLELAFAAYTTDPIAKFIIDVIIDYVCGDGFSYSFSVDKESGITAARGEEITKQVKMIIDDFWKKNNMNLRFEKKVLDQRINGMLILPVFINSIDGSVKMGFIDPKNLDKIITNELNVEDIKQIKLKGLNGNLPKILNVVREDDVPGNITYGMLVGETFYFAINNVSNQPEGVSDLIALLDTIDVMKKVLFKVIKVIDVHLSYVQHVKVKGGESAVKDFKKNNPFTTDIQRLVTDKETEVDIFNPDLKTLDITDIIRLLKNLALGSQRIPEYWMGDGGNTNLATAKEQDEPTMRKFRKIQQQVVFMLETMFKFCVHQAIIYKRAGINITPEELEHINYDIKRPELERRDFSKIGEGLDKVQAVLSKAVTAKLLSQQTAQKIFISICDMLGHDIDIDTEVSQIEKEVKENPPEPINPEENGKKEDKTNEPKAA